MQPAGGIDQQRVGADRLGALQRLVGKRAGIAAIGGADAVGARARGPDLELRHRGGAERVAGRDHDLAALAAEAFGELADGGRLAAAVHTDDQRDMRAARRIEREGPGHRRQDRGDVVGQRALDRVHLDLAFPFALAQLSHQLRRDAGAQIGGDQRLLEFVQRLGVDALAPERGADAVDQARRRAGQAGLESLEPGSHQSNLGVATR